LRRATGGAESSRSPAICYHASVPETGGPTDTNADRHDPAARKMTDTASPSIAVVIPCYNVRDHVLDVIARIGPEVAQIYVIDDCCPASSGQLVGAVMLGYETALGEGMDIIVKVDGDGQMDPALIPDFVAPILGGEADYTKGNRFFNLEEIRAMPKVRLFGNALLSFLTKLSSGYWDLFDPANGYTAIHRDVLRHLPLRKISRRWFFETDMLFRLNTLRAVVVDIPMHAKYGNETSNLKISRIAGEFLLKHLRNFGKRIFYNYYLRDMSLASIELPLGLGLLAFGLVYGAYHWISSMQADRVTPTGTIMLAVVAVIVGLQFVLAFLAYDIASVPRRPLQKRDVRLAR